MRHGLRNATHLLFLAAAFVAALCAFLVLRQALVPRGFGAYGGHYRAPYVAEARNRPLAFAGQMTCVACHEQEAKLRSKGKHAGVACEACHGPLAKHAADPAALKPALPDSARLCKTCHEADHAKPRWFPQVRTAEHSGGAACITCHQPHNPHL